MWKTWLNCWEKEESEDWKTHIFTSFLSFFLFDDSNNGNMIILNNNNSGICYYICANLYISYATVTIASLNIININCCSIVYERVFRNMLLIDWCFMIHVDNIYIKVKETFPFYKYYIQWSTFYTFWMTIYLYQTVYVLYLTILNYT